VLVSRVDLDARKIEFSLVKNTLDRNHLSPPTTMDDMGKPNKRAASKQSRPPEKVPQVNKNTPSKKSGASSGGHKPKAKSNAKRTQVAEKIAASSRSKSRGRH
jgi:ribonuclease R